MSMVLSNYWKGSLEKPHRGNTADRIGCGTRQPLRGRRVQTAREPHESEDKNDEQELPGLDTDIEKQKCEWDRAIR
jgi:hypothetical protein